MEIGNSIKCMAKVFSHGQMAELMSENMLTIKSKAKENLHGLMEENI